MSARARAILVCLAAVLPSAVTLAQPTGRTHVVQPGETLSEISQRYYGSSRHWTVIAEANGIADPRAVRPGQTLIIPPLAGAPPGEGPPPQREEPRPTPSEGAAERNLPEGLRQAVNRILTRMAPAVVIPALPAAYLALLLAFWVASNIVHVQRMRIGTAAICALLRLLVWIGCVVLAVILWLSAAGAGGEPPARWPVLAVGLGVSLVDFIGTLVVIKLLYRDTAGKTVALWVVSTALVVVAPALTLTCCLSPVGWLSLLVSGG